MIRLNDINKTVIDETKINMYRGYQYTEYDNDTPTFTNHYTMNISNERIGITISYATKEARDKDIELLDKLFDVKSIEDKANAYPDEIDALKFAMSGIKQECEPVKEEYLTWEEVQNSKKKIKVKLPNGSIRFIFCNDGDIVIARNDYREGRIYDEDLFNALKLKKVE